MRWTGLATIAVMVAMSGTPAIPHASAATATPATPPPSGDNRDRDRPRHGSSDDTHRGDGRRNDPTATPHDPGRDHRGSGDDEGVRRLFHSLDGSHRSGDQDKDRDKDQGKDKDKDKDRESDDRARNSGHDDDTQSHDSDSDRHRHD
jgi:hypothetical protein